jgi:hypothetical protein
MIDERIQEVDIDQLDTSNFEVENVGFYPYWVPTIQCAEVDCDRPVGERECFCPRHPNSGLKGNSFYAQVLDFDPGDMSKPEKERQQRYTLQSMCNMQVQEGPKASANLVDLKAGEFFTIGKMGGLPLGNYFGIAIFAKVVGKKPSKNPQHHPMKVFEVKVDARTKKMLDDRRLEIAAIAAKSIEAKRNGAKFFAPQVESKALPESSV